LGKERPEDESLIRLTSGKDLAAFKELVDRYQTSVFNACLSIIGDHHQAEEAAQDTFYQVYRSAGSFRGESKVSTWIYRIAVTRSLNLIRRNKRYRWVKSLSSLWSDDLSEGETFFATSPDEPEKRLEKKEKKDLIERAVTSLPEKQRVAFVLSKYENLTAKEISEVLGISINSVEARIHRAKLRLQKELVMILKKNSEEP
jgi:RNA polymerase sigma-70 factor (ECF subfamily)